MSTPADIGMGLGLRAVRVLAESDLIDRVSLRKPLERLLYVGTRDGARIVGATARSFTAAQKRARPVRQRKSPGTGLFDVTPTEDQQMLVDVARDLAATVIRPAAQAADTVSSAPVEVLDAANDIGVTGLGVPEALGGIMAERGAVTTVLVAEALAHGDLSLAAAMLAPGSVATAVSLWGDADHQATFLPTLVGEDPPVTALAITEPRPLFDPQALDTTARRTDGGWTLTGTKTLVILGLQVELFLVAATIDDLDVDGPGLFLIESSREGVTLQHDRAMGLRAASTCALHLDNVTVPATALVGGGRPKVYAECIHRARIAWCALAVGTAQAALDYLIPYVNERIAFGEPISHRQAVAFTISDIGIELDAMRLLTYRAAARADAGKSFAREAALARRLCAEKAMKIGSDAVQLLGGHGYITEHPAERWYRDLRAVGVMEGALLV